MFEIDWSRLWGQFVYDPKSPMIFSSGMFLFLFLGFSLCYWQLGKKTTARLAFVTAFSYFFYYKSSGVYFLLLALVTVSDFYIAQTIHRRREAEKALTGEARAHTGRWLLVLSLLIDLGLLVYFKYTNFLLELWASLSGGTFSALDIFLPVGISFFTFQSLSYTIDVYRGQLRPLSSLLDYAFYVSFFPQLVAGPIVKARDFVPQIRRPLVVTEEMFGRGVFLILAGLVKKAIISDYISVNFVERIFDQPDLYSGVENLLGLYGYTLQIYCDFSGYSDMAIGIALLLGFEFPKNFDSPYKSASITEYWRRWHISLSTWLRDYIYISMGGNRRGKVRQYLNLFVTMLIGGLWHGASLSYVLWGAFHGVLLVVDKVTHNLQERWPRWVRVAVTFHLVCLGFIMFRCQSFEKSALMLSQIFCHFEPQILLQWVSGYAGVALLMLLGYTMHFLPSSVSERTQRSITALPLLGKALIVVLVVYVVIQVKSADVQPFIYFQF